MGIYKSNYYLIYIYAISCTFVDQDKYGKIRAHDSHANSGAIKMLKKTIVAAAIMMVSVSASAFDITTKTGSGVSNTLSFNSYSVSGHVVTVTDSNRGIFDITGGIVTVGDVVKHSVVDVNVSQGGSGVGVSGSSTVYSSLAHGNIMAGTSASVGGQSMSSVGWDNSTIHETGTAVTDVDLYSTAIFFPIQVGSSTETIHTNTWVNLANIDYTTSSGSWASNTVYVK